MGGTIDRADLKTALARIATAMQGEAAAELNAADGALGDGDLGITVSRGFAEAAAADLPADLGLAFMECAKAMQRVSSSSYGTLLATAAMSAAKALKGRETFETGECRVLIEGALAAMIARGKGSLGDKTVLDVLDAVAKAMEGTEGAALYDRSLAAARATLEDFKSRPNKLGRARMFGDGSIGLYDPGQLAMVRIIEGMRS
ncbi:dihydroxyacetone kinase subunit L [Aureimonas endophytica]|uniref:Dihydroxyacetone kinase subunit L n=1 Tax=Aureimonas endophytica TaxID=2027858 RepID=A0A916ZPA3_9HYPH|nr:DAK2 domain-containing protein [Aureimonas endophytica]GGE06053.1 dihydroxyacetone kinase subunit L [Aureimonas endophytica]